MVRRVLRVLRRERAARRDEKIAEYEAKADKVNANYEMGLLTEEARRQELIDLWTECTAEVSKEVEGRSSTRPPTWPSSCSLVHEAT